MLNNNNAFYSLKAAHRKPRAIVFHEKGEFESLAHRERAKARLAMLQSEISHIAKRTGMSSSVKLAMLTPSSTSAVCCFPFIIFIQIGILTELRMRLAGQQLCWFLDVTYNCSHSSSLDSTSILKTWQLLQVFSVRIGKQQVSYQVFSSNFWLRFLPILN